MTVHVFCHIEKAGGTGIVQALRQSFGPRHCDLIPFANRTQLAKASDLKLAMVTTPGLISVAAHSIRPHQQQWDDFDLTWSTLLRDPIARYVSDFRHFVRHLSFPNDFDLWLDWTERHNFQCLALGGTGHVDDALAAIERRDVLVGHLDQVADFKRRVFARAGVNLEAVPQAEEIVNRAPSDGVDLDTLVQRHGDRIQAANAHDVELIARLPAKTDSGEQGPPLRDVKPDSRYELANRVWRTLVYKPVTLQIPWRGHGLVEYREGKARSESMWREYIAASGATSQP